MIRTGNGRSRVASAVLAAGLGIGVLAGCADDTAGSEAGADVGDIQEDPADAAAVVDPLVGQTVTVSAEVEDIIGPQAFTLDGTEGPLLVISQEGAENLVEDTPIAVTGTVRQAFDIVEVESEFGFDYDDGLYDDYEEQNYIVATAIDTTLGDTAATGPGGDGHPAADDQRLTIPTDDEEETTTMITQDRLRDVIGATAYDPDHAKIGTIGQVYYDDDTDQPKWVTVNTGLFGTRESFVPVQGADLDRDGVTVAYDKATVKDAPRIAEDGHLSSEEEQRLYRHYDVAWGDGAVGRDVSGPTTDDAMTRSEEHLRVGTEARETGRARLRKHVVTEHERVDVPVAREEVRVEREPITDANRGAAYDGPALSEEEHEVTLHAQRPVVDTETEAVERVRMGTETVRGTETVGGEVRKEEIDVDDAGPRRTRRG